MSDRARARIVELRELLERANRAYYVDNEPIMPDSRFDALMAELVELEAKHPDMADPASPAQRVGGEPIDRFRPVRHRVPMLSIDNTYGVDDLRAWNERVAKTLGDERPTFVCDPKIDGVAVSLTYEQGLLAVAVTRGDGEHGDDITAQARAIRAIPLRLAGAGAGTPAVLEVRGEIYMPNAEFERINAAREEAGEVPFANARNSTAGTLKQLDPKVTGRRRLRFVAHGRGEVEGLDGVETFSEFIERVRSLGVPTSPHTLACRDIDEVIATIERFRSQRAGLGYGVDGMVVRVDRFDQQDRLGATSKAPRWCIAFKYPAERGETVVERVDWLVGKGGTLTPRATMKPIFLAGTTVSHATLHNIEEIHRKDIRVGDRVVIEKAGEIIPQVLEVVPRQRRRGKPIEPPDRCPACGGAVEREGPKLYCVNPECPAQFREKLAWFVGRGQMDIDGLGEKLVEQLISAGLVEHFADLFTLRREDLLKLERMADKSVSNLLAAIDESRSRGLARVLAGLGIRHIGAAAARTLAGHFADADALLAASREEIEALPDFGEITATTLHAHLHSKPGRDTFRRLADVGVDLASHGPRPLAEASPVAGRTIVLTGSFEHGSREELTERLLALGAKVTGSVSSRTDLVVVGQEPGSKYDKAKELGIETWDERALLEALGASRAEH